MTMFAERIVPIIEEVKECFEQDGYQYIGENSDGTFGIDVLIDEQVKTICSIKSDYICVICCDRQSTMQMIYRKDDLISLIYDFKSFDETVIKNINNPGSEVQEGIAVTSENIQYLHDFYLYLQQKRQQYYDNI